MGTLCSLVYQEAKEDGIDSSFVDNHKDRRDHIAEEKDEHRGQDGRRELALVRLGCKQIGSGATAVSGLDETWGWVGAN